ncbi:hypothetical protein KM043_016003 [Ampulex compressa]|nr:hypothetical protein KM043_016003 [Ampulex compressa]
MMSDVLHFDCSLENEAARNAIKSFAGSLEKVFQQYRKLWDEYLLLFKQSKGVSLKSCGTTPKYGSSCEHEDTGHEEHTTQAVLSNLKSSKYTSEDVSSYTSTSKINSDEEDSFLCHSKTLCDKLENENYVTSPVFLRKRLKYMKVSSSPKSKGSSRSSILLTPEKGMRLSQMHMEQIANKDDKPSNNLETLNKIKHNAHLEFSSDFENNCNVPNVIEPKACKIVKISKIHNVDTTLLSNGKKLRQTKLVFDKPQEKTEITFCQAEENSDNLGIHTKFTPHESTTTNKQSQDLDVLIINNENSERKTFTANKRYYDQMEDGEEEIVEVSPKRVNALSKIKKHLKLRRKSPEKSTKEYSTKILKNIDYMPDSNIFVSERLTKLRTNNEFASMHNSVQKTLQPCLTKRLETISDISDSKRAADCDIVSSVHLSPIHADLKKYFQDNTGISEKTSTVTECNPIKYVEVEEHLQAGPLELISQDETFFTFNDKDEKKEVYEMHDSDFEEKMSFNNTMNKPQLCKKKLLDSFNIVPKKKENIHTHKPIKAKNERAKLDGLACWECDQYYKNLGLSDKRLQQRKNQCSRHRTRYERQSTPEDFWNPLFPDTMSSTFSDV